MGDFRDDMYRASRGYGRVQAFLDPIADLDKTASNVASSSLKKCEMATELQALTARLVSGLYDPLVR